MTPPIAYAEAVAAGGGWVPSPAECDYRAAKGALKLMRDRLGDASLTFGEAMERYDPAMLERMVAERAA